MLIGPVGARRAGGLHRLVQGDGPHAEPHGFLRPATVIDMRRQRGEVRHRPFELSVVVIVYRFDSMLRRVEHQRIEIDPVWRFIRQIPARREIVRERDDPHRGGPGVARESSHRVRVARARVVRVRPDRHGSLLKRRPVGLARRLRAVHRRDHHVVGEPLSSGVGGLLALHDQHRRVGLGDHVGETEEGIRLGKAMDAPTFVVAYQRPERLAAVRLEPRRVPHQSTVRVAVRPHGRRPPECRVPVVVNGAGAAGASLTEIEPPCC